MSTGSDSETWYSHQYVLNTAPPVRICPLPSPDVHVYLFERVATGYVNMLRNVPVAWRVADHNGELLEAGSALTTANGWVRFMLMVLTGYSGRLSVIASADDTEW